MIEVHQPVVKDSVSEPIEEEINKIFYKVLWEPLLEVLEKYNLDLFENAVTVGIAEIIKAMKSGKISMERNKLSVTFTGKFNATISKEFKKLGGKYNQKTKSWNLPYKKLPQEINVAQGQIKVKDEQMQRDMIQALPSLDQVSELIKKNDEWLEENIHKAVEDMESDWQTASRDLAISPEFTTAQREDIAKAYTDNMNLYVTDFSEKQIKELRLIMEEGISTGARSSSLIKELQGRFDISENKAKFLAKQETRLLSTQYLHQRASVAGVKTFRWSTSNDSKVRDIHKKLNKQVFSMDNLPVIHSGKNGDERGLPGQTFGCRCRAIYIFDKA